MFPKLIMRQQGLLLLNGLGWHCVCTRTEVLSKHYCQFLSLFFLPIHLLLCPALLPFGNVEAGPTTGGGN